VLTLAGASSSCGVPTRRGPGTIQLRAAQGRWRGRRCPFALWRRRTSAWWLQVHLPCIRWGSAANQHRRRWCHCQRRATDLHPPSFSAGEAGATRGRPSERRPILLRDHREWLGTLTLGPTFADDHPCALRPHPAGGRPLRHVLGPSHPGPTRGGALRPQRAFPYAPAQPRPP
jgi:hypothetical protein